MSKAFAAVTVTDVLINDVNDQQIHHWRSARFCVWCSGILRIFHKASVLERDNAGRTVSWQRSSGKITSIKNLEWFGWMVGTWITTNCFVVHLIHRHIHVNPFASSRLFTMLALMAVMKQSRLGPQPRGYLEETKGTMGNRWCWL